jgi:phosphoribosylaminoimidazole-succinocarboxamide synthase
MEKSLEIAGRGPIRRGKVRILYEFSDQRLLIVATDRISAFDVVLPAEIPGKGKILTQLSNFWFRQTADIIQNHLSASKFEDFPSELQPYKSALEYRSVLVRKAKILPFEFIIRGYLSGSLWQAYKKGEKLSGIGILPGLQESQRLPDPIFTPTTKAISGHDLPVTEKQLANAVGSETAAFLKDKCLEIYRRADDFARKRGILIADTKLEFGLDNDQLVLADELLTPDSSRFWPVESYEAGKSPPSFDKQYVRDYLNTLNWDHNPPGPQLPSEVVRITQRKYLDALHRLAGDDLDIAFFLKEFKP